MLAIYRCVSHVDPINMGDTPVSPRLHTVASEGVRGAVGGNNQMCPLAQGH